MFKLDNELIKDRFAAASFSFYTDAEIEKLSVKQILNPTAFDHLGNATSGGIYDKALGVSPFDHRAT
jgi:DNA-directed RNA polymerase I subunit RPA1